MMKKALRAMTTIEVMVMLVAMSIVIFASYGAKLASFKAYQDIIHRERAQLYAAETLEQLEAMRMSRLQQNYIRSWETFLGSKSDGDYQIVQGDGLSDLSLVPLNPGYEITDVDEASVRFYDNVGDLADPSDDGQDGFFSRLERRVTVREIATPADAPQKKLVIVSVYWGAPGTYELESPQQIIVQSLYSDHTQPAFAL